jgi:hypothetical protein
MKQKNDLVVVTPSMLGDYINPTPTPLDKNQSFSGLSEVSWLKSAVAGTGGVAPGEFATLDTQNRAFQRERVASLDFEVKILHTILGNDYKSVPEIHMRVKRKGNVWKIQIIDGQQRVMAILRFLDDKFCLPSNFIINTGETNVNLGGMNIRDLKDKEPAMYNRIINYGVRCRWYENLSDEETSDLFTELLNNVTQMKPQEIRNAVLGPVSTYVRDKVRPIGSMPLHPLFARMTLNPGTTKEKQVMNLFNISLGGRMEMDEWLTELIYLKSADFRGGIKGQTHLTEWWKDVQRNGIYKNGFTDKKKIDSLLNLAHEVLVAANVSYANKMNSMKSLMLVLYADELKSKYGKIIAGTYVKKFFEVYEKWDSPDQVVAAIKGGITQLNGSVLPEFNNLFNGKNANAIGTICTILDHEFSKDPEGFGIIVIDPNDTFSDTQKHQKWIEQGKTDYYTGLPLDYADAAGDHYIPRSWGIKMGGVTETHNLVITSIANNLKKSNMGGDEFKQLLRMGKFSEEVCS